jgi:Zn-dependent protease/predicted transcriptional regulator
MWGRSIRIARWHNRSVEVDASWILVSSLIVWGLATRIFHVGLPDTGLNIRMVMAVFGLVGVFGSILLHEIAHAIVARLHGVHRARIKLFVFGGVARDDNIVPAPQADIQIALAGPMVSLGLALVLWFGARVGDLAWSFEHVGVVLYVLSVFNLILGLGNLIPAYPLDGGHILRAVLMMRSGDAACATRQTMLLSVAFAVGLIVLGLLVGFSGRTVGGLWTAVVGLFLLSTVQSARGRIQPEAALMGQTVGDLMSRNPFTARPEQSLSELVRQVFFDKSVSFAPVVENGAVLGYVDKHLIRRLDPENWPTTVVDDVIESITDENAVSPDLSISDLLDRTDRTGRRKFLVVVGTQLVGVITLADLVPVLRVAPARPTKAASLAGF